MPLRPCTTCRRLYNDTGASSTGKCPAHRRATWRAHQATRTEHGREYGSTWRRLRVAVLARDQWTCVYCGTPAGTIDAVHPRSRGGQTSPANSVGACTYCNTSKGNRTVPEWIASGCAPAGAATFWARWSA